jgi:hypothetical protein
MSVIDTSRIVIDDSKVMFQVVESLTDNSRGITYASNMLQYRPLVRLIVQSMIDKEKCFVKLTPGVNIKKTFFPTLKF